MYHLTRSTKVSQKAKAAAPSRDDASISLSSWAGLDVSDHKKSVDRIVHSRFANGAHHHPDKKTKKQTPRDDASISVSSWGYIDTDQPRASSAARNSDRLHSSDRDINYYPSAPSGTRSSGTTSGTTLKPAVAVPKPHRARESSWGNMDVQFMANIAEQREQVARHLMQQQQRTSSTTMNRKPPLRSSSKTQRTLTSKKAAAAATSFVRCQHETDWREQAQEPSTRWCERST